MNTKGENKQKTTTIGLIVHPGPTKGRGDGTHAK